MRENDLSEKSVPSLDEIAEALRDETETIDDQPFIHFVSCLDETAWTGIDQVVVHSTSDGVTRIAFRPDCASQNSVFVAIPEPIVIAMARQIQNRLELRKKYPDFFSPHTNSEPNKIISAG
jgi:hypothetical protein